METPIGHVPTPESLDIDGLDMSAEDLATCLRVDAEEWRAEIPQITEWFDKFGDKLPDRALDRARRPEGPPRRRVTPGSGLRVAALLAPPASRVP